MLLFGNQSMSFQANPSSSTEGEGARTVLNKIFVVSILPPFVLICVGVSVFCFIRRRRSRKLDGSRSQAYDSSLILDQLRIENAALHDVWAERQRRGIGPNSISSLPKQQQESTQTKPFGSSYYYAHNNPGAKGGYKDGLRMEDYAMNGPRLLARSGAVNSSTGDAEGTSSASMSLVNGMPDGPETVVTAAATPKLTQVKRVIYVTQYLWDDPGTGKATIRIDHLPHPRRPGEQVPWKEANVTNVCVNVIGEGLEAVLQSTASRPTPVETGAHAADGSGCEYRLSIPKLYGPVTSAIAVSKPSRLLIRLEKRTTLLDRSNAKPWPHPQKKLL
jgi:hypothetical protein